MKPLKIGIVVESTGLSVRQALLAAARMGAKGVQVDGVRGRLATAGSLAAAALLTCGCLERRPRVVLADLLADVARIGHGAPPLAAAGSLLAGPATVRSGGTGG